MVDCYFKRGRKCAVLTRSVCKGCSFRKTAKELIDGRDKALDRLMSLPSEERNYYMRKYGLEQRDDET